MDHLTNIKLRRSKVEINFRPLGVKIAEDGTVEEKCKICIKNKFKYTCPRCGLNYCSLECFKSDRHQDCSEAFYKAEVEKCLKSDKISEESKMQMVEMLKRDKIERELEDENVPEDEEFDELTEMLEHLSPEERKLFEDGITDDSIIKSIQSSIKYWWDENFLIIPECGPVLRLVPSLAVTLTPHWTISVYVTNLLIAYCFIYRRYLSDPEDLLQESSDELIHIALAFNNENKIEEMENSLIDIFKHIEKLSNSEAAFVALQDAKKVTSSVLKMRHGLSHISDLLGNKKLPKSKRVFSKKIDFYHSWLLTLTDVSEFGNKIELFHNTKKDEYDKFEKDKSKLIESNNICTLEKALITELD